MIELFLCEARRQIRSIVDLCEDFDVRRSRTKRANQNDFYFNIVTARLRAFTKMSISSLLV